MDKRALEYSRLRKSPVLWCIKKFIGDYPLFHSTCDEETGYIRDTFGSEARIVQVPNFIELPREVERSAENYLLFLGRLHWKKGIKNLIQALAGTEEFRQSDHVLKIAGKGLPAYEQELRDLVASLEMGDKIDFVGQVEGEEKQHLLANASWTIMPSHTENFGMVVLESLAQNTPVIASKGSPWASLETAHLGFWVDNSSQALSEVIKKILAMTPSEYESYRTGGRDFVEKNFDVRQNIGKWAEIYRSLE